MNIRLSSLKLQMMTQRSKQQKHCSSSYKRGLTFYPHVENIGIIEIPVLS
jgi:hypothetical protein